MTPEIPMDALRKIARMPNSCVGYYMEEPVKAVRAYVKAVDAQADAAKDEALISAILTAWYESACSPRELSSNLLSDWKRVARAAIAKSRGEAQ